MWQTPTLCTHLLCSAGIGQKRQAQLPNPPEPLKFRRIDQPEQERAFFAIE
ncbi:MAG: hypothetical protein IPK83_19030 [Planctomycetes bacterium]|nr:hypothetical protein [Planctomycetota bacterium]